MKHFRRILSGLMAMVLMLAALAPLSAKAEDDSTGGGKVVRVGWYQSDLFQVGEAGEEKSGYCYHYLQKIANYNGWNYEYVYGEWPDLLEKLENGEIDIMAGVSDTEEREAYMSFPSFEMGKENYCLYQHASDQTMDIADPGSFHGQRIGGINNNRMTHFLEQWIAENGFDLEIVYYDTFDERDADFASGALDGVVATDNNIPLDADYSLVTSVGKEPYYLAVTKSRTDLLSELNSALSLLQQMDPYFLQNLQFTCYGTTLSNASMTDEEQAWLDAHDTLTIGCMNDYMPYCGTTASGKVTGLITDVMNAALKELRIEDRLQLSYQPYDDYEDMVKALQDGEIDAAFPVGGGDWNIDQDNIDATSAVVTAGMDLVYSGNYQDTDGAVFAVNENNNLQIYFIERNYPDAKLVMCKDISACLNAVNQGFADFTIINGLRADLVRGSSAYSSLNVMQLQVTDDRALGVRHGNSALLLLLDRGLQLIGSDYGTSASYYYMDANNTTSVIDFLRMHMRAVIGFLLLFIALLVAMFYFYARGLQRAQKETDSQLTRNRELTTQLESQNRDLEAAKDAADAANRAKSTFLFSMSHDIRTPMNAIIGFTELLKKHRDDPARMDSDIEKIESSSQFLLSLINNVLEMARIESGSTVLEETPGDARQFSDELYAVFDEQMRAKRIRFTRAMDVEHAYVRYDPVKLREIFLNILSNACKYTKEGGSVTMDIRELPCEREGYARFRTSITDTGIGMSQEYLPHLFEEFSREKTVTDSRIEGTGLGMPIVKRLVDLMGGTIEVESELGKGSAFTVTLEHPIAEAEDLPEQEAPSADPGQFVGRRILLAEDNDLNAEIAEEILSEVGFEVDRAEDGVICLRMLSAAEAGHYDVILMDIQMPNMNGYETARAIRAMRDPRKAGIKILAMTANAFEEDKREAANAGMDGHLAKPIDVPALMKALAGMIE